VEYEMIHNKRKTHYSDNKGNPLAVLQLFCRGCRVDCSCRFRIIFFRDFPCYSLVVLYRIRTFQQITVKEWESNYKKKHDKNIDRAKQCFCNGNLPDGFFEEMAWCSNC